MSGRPQPALSFTSLLPSACALALVIACAADFCLVAGPRPLLFVPCCSGLALAIGVGCGFAWRAAFWLVGFLPRLLARAIWPLALLAVALRIAQLLGAQKRLHGAYTGLALAVLVTCVVAALAFSLLLGAVQPVGPERRAVLLQCSPRTRGLVSLALLATAAALAFADRALYVDLYLLAHLTLRVSAVFLITFALALAHDLLRLPALSRSVLAGLALWLGIVLFTLNEAHAPTLQAFLLRPWPGLVLGTARNLLDVDRDGYASVLGGGDCAPFDPRVHPGAREIPGNGIDDNCVLGDARPQTQMSVKVGLPTAPSPLDIVLITVDSLRRDRVGLYAANSAPASRRLTPSLDRWAANATVFGRAYSPGGWTSLALPALMRGVYPRRLRWTRFYETNAHRLLRGPLAPQLRAGEAPTWLFAFPAYDEHPPLAEWLSRRGMSTVAVVDDGRSEILRRGTGIERGFREYIEINPGPSAANDDAVTASRAISVLNRNWASRRLFLWVHFFGIHSPSERHPGTPHYGSSVADRYDHEIRYFDTQLARLLEALDRRSHPTAVFLTADHGEELETTVRHHGYSVAEQVISVPLVARVPGWTAGRSDGLVNLIDLMPTLLALTRTPAPGGLDGMDLHAATESRPGTGRVLLSDTWRFDVDERLVADLVAAYDGHRKLIVDQLAYGSYFYDPMQPARQPTLRFGAMIDRLSKVAYGYLEETGGAPSPTD